MAQTQTAHEAVPDSEGKREQSSIIFPYFDMDEAVKVAKAIFDVQGSSCQLDQIAAHIKESPTSSSFRGKMSAAKIFGFITVGQGTATLTGLGSQLCDQQQEPKARADGFLNVPLYKAIYDKFRGTALPQETGLEGAMVSLGVAPKQKERARQVFKRSAQQAGFFQFGTDRLVVPPIRGSAAAVPVVSPEQEREPSREENQNQQKRHSGGGGGEEYHPFIQGLLKKLPTPDSDWPMDGRIKWLQTAANIFDLMYTNSDEDNKRAINITFQKDSAR